MTRANRCWVGLRSVCGDQVLEPMADVLAQRVIRRAQVCESLAGFFRDVMVDSCDVCGLTVGQGHSSGLHAQCAETFCDLYAVGAGYYTSGDEVVQPVSNAGREYVNRILHSAYDQSCCVLRRATYVFLSTIPSQSRPPLTDSRSHSLSIVRIV